MIILITSCKINDKYRKALRETWLKDTALPHLFIVGGAESTHKDDDVLHVQAKDDYNSVPKKQFEAFKYCLQNEQFDHIFICDDDAYVCMDRLLDSDYLMHDYYGGGPVRMWDKPYYVLGGPGIFLSRKAVEEIVNNGEENLYAPVAHNVAICNVSKEDQYWGDRFIGITLNKAGIRPAYDERFVDINLDPLAGKPKQYNNIIAYHGKSNIPKIDVKPIDIEDIHRHFQEPLRPIRVAMVLDQWSKGGAEKEFADMIVDSDPEKIQYVGIALNIAWEFYLRNDLKGKLPPFHTWEKRGYDRAIDKDYLTLHHTFEEAVSYATKEADVIIKWHTLNRFLERIKKPSILLGNATAWYTESKYKRIHADKYVGNSRWSADWLPKHAHNKLVIYSGHSESRIETKNGRDHFKEKLGLSENDKIVSHIGRINLDKNLKLIAKAVSSLPEEWKLVLVGRVPVFNKEELDGILEEYIPNRYKLVSWVDHVGDAFAASDVFVLTSYYEGFSNALAEAWMSKTPTVFSTCGSANELMEKYGNIGIDIRTDASVEEIADAIVRAPFNTEGVTNAYNMIKTFTKEKSARNWERCITEVCYNRNTLKVGLLVPNLSPSETAWVKALINNTCRGQIEYTVLTPENHKKDLTDFDAIITWGIENLAPLVANLDTPIIMCSHYMNDYNAITLKNTCHLGTHFVATSQTTNVFPKEVKNSVSVINNTYRDLVVDEDRKDMRSSWGAKSKDILVGFIGRWENRKNPLALARGIKELPEKYKAVFIGSGWDVDRLNEILLPDRYILIPPQKNIGNCYNALDAVMVSSDSEGTCNVILESWMMKKPLICTDVGLYKELRQFTSRFLGVPIEKNDLSANIASAIQRALKVKSVELQHLRDLIFEKFNNTNFTNGWLNLIQKSVDDFKNFHKPMFEPDPYFEVFELMKQYKTTKRVARKLNIMKFPLPEGEKEWTYPLVERYLR
tara:strand:- start:8558 stop:11446 length:2889 start_codon:yes stop_codon:yes gene_type:complete